MNVTAKDDIETLFQIVEIAEAQTLKPGKMPKTKQKNNPLPPPRSWELSQNKQNILVFFTLMPMILYNLMTREIIPGVKNSLKAEHY